MNASGGGEAMAATVTSTNGESFRSEDGPDVRMESHQQTELALPRAILREAAARDSTAFKRLLDIGISLVLLIVLLPIGLLVALAIKLADGGPVIFWQRRVGQAGRTFWFPKFRSMHVGAEHMHDIMVSEQDDQDAITFKMRHDPRVTAIGRVIRTLSFDELPQLWCVMKGDMSMVGPRPPLPKEVARYTPLAQRRLEVRPGLTGLWQVSGRSTIPFAHQLALDLEYIDNHSLALDLKLLLLTVPAVLSCRGAW